MSDRNSINKKNCDDNSNSIKKFNTNKNANNSKSGISIKKLESREINNIFRNYSFKDLIVKNHEIETKNNEELSTNNINNSTNKLSTNNNSLNIKKNSLGSNDYLFQKYNKKKNYSPYIISLFSKTNNVNNVKSNQNISITERKSSISGKNEQNFSKTNKNLKIWMLLNGKDKNDKANKLSNANETEKKDSFSGDLSDLLNESYAYVKNFFFDKYNNTRKRCILRKKALIGLNPKSAYNAKNNDKDKSDNSDNSSIEMIEKLKNKSVSLDQEKEYIGDFKRVISQKKQKRIHEYNKEYVFSTSRSKSSNNYDNSTNNTFREKIYYPDVFYLNKNNNLHKNTHVSYLFSKLRANNKLI
jgi:hypothetical protein